MNLHWWRWSKWSILDEFRASNTCFLGLKLDLQVVKLFCETSVKNIFNDSNTISPKSVKNMKISSIFQDFHEFHRFSKMLNHRFSVGKLRNLTFSNDFPKFHKKIKKWIYTGGVHPNDRFLMIFMLQTPVFLGLKLDFQVLKLFFKKSVKKYLQRQQYNFSKICQKTWKFSKLWFFWNVLDHFTEISTVIMILKNEK